MEALLVVEQKCEVQWRRSEPLGSDGTVCMPSYGPTPDKTCEQVVLWSAGSEDIK